MRAKPTFFNLMAITFMMLAISFPIQIWIMYGVSDVDMILSKMTYLNWLLVVMFSVIALLSFRVSKSLLYLLPITCVAVFFNNWAVASYGNDFTFGQTFASSLGFLGMAGTFYLPKFSSLLMHTKNRWWEPAPRYKKSLPVQIQHDKSLINGLSFDISESGIFIQQDSMLSLANLTIGQIINMQIQLPHGTVTCNAEVVRKTNIGEGNYPAGLGMRFIEPSAYLKQSITDSLETSMVH